MVAITQHLALDGNATTKMGNAAAHQAFGQVFKMATRVVYQYQLLLVVPLDVEAGQFGIGVDACAPRCG